jgi:hypothetical protein
MTEAQQRNREFNEQVKAECIAAVKVAASGALIKTGQSGEALQQSNKIIAALVEILEAKPAALFIGAEYIGDKGTTLLIKQNFAAAKAAAA